MIHKLTPEFRGKRKWGEFAPLPVVKKT